MWDDFITATTAHGLQLHTTKATIFLQHDTRSPKQQHGDSARDERRNLATRKGSQISWPEHHRQKATKAKFEHRIRCAWPDFTSHRQELTTTKFPWKSMQKLFDTTVTPSLFYASGTWTMTEDMPKKLHTTQRRMLRIIMHIVVRRVAFFRIYF